MESVKRIHYIDVLKGIGILFVLLGHINNQEWSGYLYSFHMALFFFISGDVAESIEIWHFQRICS